MTPSLHLLAQVYNVQLFQSTLKFLAELSLYADFKAPGNIKSKGKHLS